MKSLKILLTISLLVTVTLADEITLSSNTNSTDTFNYNQCGGTPLTTPPKSKLDCKSMMSEFCCYVSATMMGYPISLCMFNKNRLKSSDISELNKNIILTQPIILLSQV